MEKDNLYRKMNTYLFGKLDEIKYKFTVLSKKRFYRYGLPFVVFMIGGSFGLREWTQVRYQFSQVKGISREQAEKMGLHKERKVTLEETFEEIQKIDIDNWENKRGPRPWEQPEKVEKKK